MLKIVLISLLRIPLKNAMSVLVYGAVSNVPKTLRPADGNVA
jgi:hypothetical protein